MPPAPAKPASVQPPPVSRPVKTVRPEPMPVPQAIEMFFPQTPPAPRPVEFAQPEPPPAPEAIHLVTPAPEPPVTQITIIPEPAPREAAPVAEEARTILVLDNDLSIRRLLRRVLEREGYKTYELGHAANLVSELRRTPLDLLITDLDVPQQEGIEMLGALQREFPALRIIVLSGFWAAGSFRVRGVPRVSAVLAKPFRTEALLESVRTALGTTQAARVSVRA